MPVSTTPKDSVEATTPALAARRFAGNPIITSADVPPSRAGWEILGVFNPGVFNYGGRVGLVLRVAERPPQEPGWLTVAVLEESEPEGVRCLRWKTTDPQLDARDPRIVRYAGETYLTSISHLRLAWSSDGERFAVEPLPALQGVGALQTFGIEDARVALLDGTYYLSYSGSSPLGVGVGMSSTRDWKTFANHGMPLCPDNKDCVLFDERVAGRYWCLHRPSNVHIPGAHLWLAESPDLHHWGGHQCLAATRPGSWDSARIGACGPPIRTAAGWLVIYHGADAGNHYQLGAMLLAIDNPRQVLARLAEPILSPEADYERHGFMPNVIFNNGQLVQGDALVLYYGACDETVCGARMSIAAILQRLATEGQS